MTTEEELMAAQDDALEAERRLEGAELDMLNAKRNIEQLLLKLEQLNAQIKEATKPDPLGQTMEEFKREQFRAEYTNGFVDDDY